MKRTVIAALGSAIIATLVADAAAKANTIDFGVAAFDGSITYQGGASLDKSTLLDLDLSLLLVNEVHSDDQSGLALFDPISLSAMTSPPSSQIIYGSGTGPGPLGADVILSWPMVAPPGTDVFTEKLTTVMSVNRGISDQIGLQLTGRVSDTAGLFVNVPVLLSLTANQAGGSIDVSFTNTSSVTPVIPEPSTWAMMTLGFVALGYAGFRKRLNFGRMAENVTPSV
jgi:hypothetical protein